MSTYLRDIPNNTLERIAIGPQLLTATNTSGAIDLLQGDGRCHAILALNVWNATSLDVKFQESTTTNSGFVDITGASFTQVTTTQANPLMISFDRNQRYVRSIATVSGTTIGAALLVGEQLKQIP